jgi:hypothetical protein
MSAIQNRVAEYKGKKYRLLYIGDTKYGRRAHLAFFDGSKDFWVDGALVTVINGGKSSTYRPWYRDYCPCSRTPYCKCGSDAPCCMCE